MSEPVTGADTRPDPDAVEAIVVADTGQATEDLLNGSNKLSVVVEARRVLCLLLRDKCGLSYGQINRRFGLRGHYAALHRCEKAEHLLLTSNYFRTRYRRCERAVDELGKGAPHA